MTGSNQLVTDNQTKEDGTLQTKLHTLPSILFIQLKRFAFSPEYQTIQKINSYFSFPLELSLDAYTDSPNQPATYVLQSVFIHGGTITSGHYYSYICTECDENATPTQWCMFNDEQVEKVSLENVFDHAFGRVEDPTPKKSSRKTMEKDETYMHSISDDSSEDIGQIAEKDEIGKSSERGGKTRPSRLCLRGGREQFTLDKRTTSAYMLVYVKKTPFELSPLTPTKSISPSFIHKLLLIDMKAHLKEYYEMQGINLHLYSMQMFNEVVGCALPQPLVKKHWKDQSITERTLEEFGEELKVPAKRQDWWLMRKSPISGKLLPFQRIQKKELRECSVDLVDMYGVDQADLVLYCRDKQGLDFTRVMKKKGNKEMEDNKEEEEYLVILKIPEKNIQWCDVLVRSTLPLHLFCQCIAKIVGKVRVVNNSKTV